MAEGHHRIGREGWGDDRLGTRCLDHNRIYRKAILRIDRAVVRAQEALGQEQQQFVGAIAERQMRFSDPQVLRERALELKAAAVRIQPDLGHLSAHGIDHTRTRPKGILIGGQLHNPSDAELALELADRLARHIGRQCTHRRHRQPSWMIAVHGLECRSYALEYCARVGTEHAKQ